MKSKNIVAVFLSSLIVLACFWVVVNQQDIIDWWRLRGYVASPAIAALSTDSSMNDEGQRLFYVHDPELLDKTNFDGKCSNNEETIILGCYISHDKIYIFKVDDPRLNGVEEVTASHEMLHAAYDRLSISEKTELDKVLLQTFADLNDDRLNKTIASYKARDPAIVPNELHSILGSEYRKLPGQLENHYRKYFYDRLVVVTKAEAYEEEFTKREEKIAEFDTRIKSLDDQISSQQSNLLLLGSGLENEQQQLDSQKSNPEAYNRSIPAYNAKVSNYNNKIKQLKSLISEYNDLVNQRNAIALEEQDLIKAIDSRISER